MELQDNKKCWIFDLDKKDVMSVTNNSLLIRIENNIDRDVNDIYFRFRIISNEISKQLFQDVDEDMKYIRGYMYERKIIDIKINKVRNIMNISSYLEDGYKLATFEKIHFLIMERLSNIIDSGLSHYECRTIESDWSYYIGELKSKKYNKELKPEAIKDELKRMLVYHWRKNDKPIDDYSIVLKVSYPKITILLYISYFIFLVIPSIMSAIIYDSFKEQLNTSIKFKLITLVILMALPFIIFCLIKICIKMLKVIKIFLCGIIRFFYNIFMCLKKNIQKCIYGIR